MVEKLSMSRSFCSARRHMENAIKTSSARADKIGINVPKARATAIRNAMPKTAITGW